MDGTTDIESYEFGSGIIGVNLINETGHAVSIDKNEISITFDLLAEVGLSSE